MCHTEEEHEHRLVGLSDLGQVVVQVGEQSHQESGQQRRFVLHTVNLQQAEDAAPTGGDAQELGSVDLRLAEEHVGALVPERNEIARNDTDCRHGEAAEVFEVVFALVRESGEHRVQVGQVDKRQTGFRGAIEDQSERRLLDVVEGENLGKQSRTEARNRGTQRHTHACPAKAEIFGRECRLSPVLADAFRMAKQYFAGDTRRCHTGEITLDVGCEHRNTGRRQLLCRHLKRAGLARACRAGDEAVAVEHADRDAHLHGRIGYAVHESAGLDDRPVECVSGFDGCDRLGRPEGGWGGVFVRGASGRSDIRLRLLAGERRPIHFARSLLAAATASAASAASAMRQSLFARLRATGDGHSDEWARLGVITRPDGHLSRGSPTAET